MQKWENLENAIKKHEEAKQSEESKTDELRVELEQEYVKLQESRSALGKKEDKLIQDRNKSRQEKERLEEDHLKELSRMRKSELTRVLSASIFCLIVGLCISFAFLFRPCEPDTVEIPDQN